MQFTELQKTLNQLKQIVDNLDSNHSALIDFDMSLEKTRKVYDILSELKLEKLSKKDVDLQVEKLELPKEEIPEDELLDRIDEEAIKLMDEKDSLEFVVEETVEEKEEEKQIIDKISEEKEIVEETPEVKKEVEEIQEIKTKPKLVETNETVADKFEEKKSLNDILANIGNNEDLASQLEKRPIKDLKNAIALNDKIWFTRELFEGNNDFYLSTLDKINNARNVKDAVEIVGKLNWDMDESATKRFMELVYRRFV